MRKTILLGALIVLSGAGALAQASVAGPTESNTVVASQTGAPAIRSEKHGHERRSASHVARRDHGRKHHDEARKGEERRKHDRH
jgi:hypothetical protein